MEFILPKISSIKNTVCYAIVFDTGYFYIGATTNFEKRINQHISAIKRNPINYLISMKHYPKKCKFIKLIACDNIDTVFKYEKDFIQLNANNNKMINGVYGTEKVQQFSTKINEAYKSLTNNTII